MEPHKQDNIKFICIFLFAFGFLCDTARAECKTIQVSGASFQDGVEGDYVIDGAMCEPGYRVYRQSEPAPGWGTTFYLYYFDDDRKEFAGWIFSMYLCSDMSFVRNKDNTFNPEKITGPWEEFLGGDYVTNYDFSVKCKESTLPTWAIAPIALLGSLLVIFISLLPLCWIRVSRKRRLLNQEVNNATTPQNDTIPTVYQEIPPPYCEHVPQFENALMFSQSHVIQNYTATNGFSNAVYTAPYRQPEDLPPVYDVIQDTNGNNCNSSAPQLNFSVQQELQTSLASVHRNSTHTVSRLGLPSDLSSRVRHSNDVSNIVSTEIPNGSVGLVATGRCLSNTCCSEVPTKRPRKDNSSQDDSSAGPLNVSVNSACNTTQGEIHQIHTLHSNSTNSVQNCRSEYCAPRNCDNCSITYEEKSSKNPETEVKNTKSQKPRGTNTAPGSTSRPASSSTRNNEKEAVSVPEPVRDHKTVPEHERVSVYERAQVHNTVPEHERVPVQRPELIHETVPTHEIVHETVPSEKPQNTIKRRRSKSKNKSGKNSFVTEYAGNVNAKRFSVSMLNAQVRQYQPFSSPDCVNGANYEQSCVEEKPTKHLVSCDIDVTKYKTPSRNNNATTSRVVSHNSCEPTSIGTII